MTRRRVSPGLWHFAALILLLVQVRTLHAAPLENRLRVVSREELLMAMGLQKGYDPAATTNGARFQAEVLLLLAGHARTQDPEGPPLFVSHRDWFHAFLEVTGLTMESAPAPALLAYRHGKDIKIDYRTDRVIRNVRKGPIPGLAVNVVIGWPKVNGGPTMYSYSDTHSRPHLKVTNKRVITYRLLDFGDIISYDQVEGLTGRPVSGALGFLFSIIGEGDLVESRMAISRDGLQVARTLSKKGYIGVTTTVTVYPDGRTEKDLPAGRPDLLALETRLKQPSKIDYVPIDSSLREAEINSGWVVYR